MPDEQRVTFHTLLVYVVHGVVPVQRGKRGEALRAHRALQGVMVENMRRHCQLGGAGGMGIELRGR